MKILNKIKNFFTRDLSESEVYYKLFYYLEENQEYSYPYPLNIYFGDSSHYMIFSDNGKLYKLPFSVSGSQISIGNIIEVDVSHEFTEVQSRMLLREKENGDYTFVSFSASSILNRSGEIDTTELFDNFEKHFDVSEKPFVTIRHIHEDNFKFGHVDEVYRYGNLLVTIGTLYADKLLTRQTIKNLQDNPSEWGISIGFYSKKQETLKLNNISIPIHTDGSLFEISFLREKQAANYFTRTFSIDKEIKMARDKDTALKTLKDYGLSDEDANEIINNGDTIMNEISQRGMIVRETEELEPKTFEPEVQILETLNDIVVEDEILNEVSRRFSNTFNSKFEALATENMELRSIIGNLENRLNALEKPIEEKVREAVDDLPAARTIIRYQRPSQQSAETRANLDINKQFEQFAKE